MKLFYVRMHNDNPPMIMFGETRAKVGRLVKKMLGPDMVDEVIPISRQDAEMTFGDKYSQLARWNMLRSEEVTKSSVLTGNNPFLREKIDIKKADMGDVIDDFKSSDAPQFDGKSVNKKRQMAIAAKLQANEELKQSLKLSTVSEGIDTKVLKTFKVMIKDGEEDSVRLLLQGMPKHTKTMYMKKLRLKEDQNIDLRTKVYKETLQNLNQSKSLEVPLPFYDINEDNDSHYKMTYTKGTAKNNKLHLDVHHTAVNLKGERPDNRPRLDHLIKNSQQHKTMKSKGYSISRYGSHDNHDGHESQHGNKPNITKEDVNEKGLEEKTPIKPVVVDRKQPNLKVPNPNFKSKNPPRVKKYKRPEDQYIETKEAPPGTYFTKSGQLKKGDPASDGKGGEKLASDPLDKQRKTIVNLKNYPK